MPTSSPSHPFDPSALLSAVLPCAGEDQYQRTLVEFGRACGMLPDQAIEGLDKWLRRRSVRRSDYLTGELDVSRSGQPFTWFENRVLHWAFFTLDLESGRQPTPEYIAGMLKRTAEEVAAEEHRQRTTIGNIKGFDL